MFSFPSLETILKILKDQYGRRIRKLRISLTDKCNLRCHYCMPLDAKFMNEESFMKDYQYYDIVNELCDLGLEEVRITGGEPLLRKSFINIIEKLSKAPLAKLGLTTNGILLERYLNHLKDNKVKYLNVSLDSLNAQNFQNITYGNHMDRVISNILKAKQMGFHVKINMVVMKSINDHEIFDFVNFSGKTGIEVRFLEVMRVGYACKSQSDQFISANEIISNLSARYVLTRKTDEHDSTSFNYQLSNQARIGFIASESQPFCGNCSRWRLSADGILRSCLLKDDGMSVKDLTREDRHTIYTSLLGMKPYLRPPEVTHQMNEIGG